MVATKFISVACLLISTASVSFAQEQSNNNNVGNINPNYVKLMNYSMLFYEAQRSGKLPENNRISWYE